MTRYALRTQPVTSCVPPRWAQTLPQTASDLYAGMLFVGAGGARRLYVNAVWKFALTNEDIYGLQRFGQHVEQALGTECEMVMARSGGYRAQRQQ